MLRSLPGLPWLALSGLLHLLALAGLTSGALWPSGVAATVPAAAAASPGETRPAEGPARSGKAPAPDRRATADASARARPERAGRPSPRAEPRAPAGQEETPARGRMVPGASWPLTTQETGTADRSARSGPGREGDGILHPGGETTEPPMGPGATPPDAFMDGGATPSGAVGPVNAAAPAMEGPSISPAPQGEPPAGPAPPRRTGRLALMALGTHTSYDTGPRARYDLVVVSPEKHEKAVLRKARSAHPDALVFAYLNTMDVMLVRSRERPSFWKEREDWFLHDGDGERVRVRVKGYKGPRARYGMNVAHPGWQRYLGKQAASLLELGYDGIQLDNVETHYSYGLLNVGRWISALPVEMTEERWFAGEEEMLRVIRTMADEAGFADREIIFNHVRAGEPERSMAYLAPVDGANSEGWMSLKVDPGGAWGWRSRVDLIRRAGAAGKRTNVLALASLHSPEEALFAYASYLMAQHGERSTFWYGKTYRAEEARWFWFYDAALGAPAGDMEEIGSSGVFRRPFTRGLVLVNPQTDPRRVTLEPGYVDEAFEPVGALELRAKEGRILTLAGAAPPGRRVLEAERCVRTGEPGVPARVVADEGWSGGRAVALEDPRYRCELEVRLVAGTWRVVVEGRGQGPQADAALVTLAGETRRVAFGLSPRQIVEFDLERPEEKITLRAAEAGVIVDRMVLVPVERAR